MTSKPPYHSLATPLTIPQVSISIPLLSFPSGNAKDLRAPERPMTLKTRAPFSTTTARLPVRGSSDRSTTRMSPSRRAHWGTSSSRRMKNVDTGLGASRFRISRGFSDQEAAGDGNPVIFSSCTAAPLPRPRGPRRDPPTWSCNKKIRDPASCPIHGASIALRPQQIFFRARDRH